MKPTRFFDFLVCLAFLPVLSYGTTTQAQTPELSRLLYAQAKPGAGFGSSVAIDGNYLVVGAPHGTELGGRAVVYERSGTQWQQRAVLMSPHWWTHLVDEFGYAVAISGDRIAVGAPRFDGERGKVYLFERDPSTNTWHEAGDVVPTFPLPGVKFGFSVDLDGDRLVVGAPHTPDAYENPAGMVHIFDLSTGDEATFVASDGGDNKFGWSVSISGDWAAVGAPETDFGLLSDQPLFDAGQVEVFHFRGPGYTWQDAWVRHRRMNDSDVDIPAGGRFGTAVSLRGELLVVGAPNVNRAYLYTFDTAGNAWSRHRYRELYTGFGRFGAAVATDGQDVFVGAPYSSGYEGGGYKDEIYKGEVFAFMRRNGWTDPQRLLASTGAAEDHFGSAVAAFGDDVVVGAPQDDDVKVDAGAAFTYVLPLDCRVEVVKRTVYIDGVPYEYVEFEYNELCFQVADAYQHLYAEWNSEGGKRTTAEAAAAATPDAFTLEPNYPNPFNPATTIAFSLPEESPVRLAVYDLTGRQVALLMDGVRAAGRHEVRFEAGELPSGTYLYRLQAGTFSQVRQLVLMK